MSRSHPTASGTNRKLTCTTPPGATPARCHSPFKSCTVPRPIGWISTVNRRGRQLCPLQPMAEPDIRSADGDVRRQPVFRRTAQAYGDQRRRNRMVRLEHGTYALREAINISAIEWPDGVDEFDKAGLTKAACIDAPGPRVAESPAHFECRYLSTHRLRRQLRPRLGRCGLR